MIGAFARMRACMRACMHVPQGLNTLLLRVVARRRPEAQRHTSDGAPARA